MGNAFASWMVITSLRNSSLPPASEIGFRLEYREPNSGLPVSGSRSGHTYRDPIPFGGDFVFIRLIAIMTVTTTARDEDPSGIFDGHETSSVSVPIAVLSLPNKFPATFSFCVHSNLTIILFVTMAKGSKRAPIGSVSGICNGRLSGTIVK
jgi:hypothetical protein